MSNPPISPPLPWIPRWAWLTGLAALVVVAGALWWWWFVDRCGPGVRRVGPRDECVGMTDGEVVFSPDLAAVMDKIREENLRVQGTGLPFVSVAYVVAVPAVAEDTSVVLRHELQGAHLAQLRANGAAGVQPLIRLLVANTGDDNVHWAPVVRRLRETPDTSGARLVAVAGLGRSFEATQQAITALAQDEIPMVASRLTADDLNGAAPGISAEGLVRVGPTNSDEAKAVVAYLKQDPQNRSALLVADTNPQDLYAQTLADAFTDAFGDGLLAPDERYNGALPGVASIFRQMMGDICDQRPDVVYFAGRGEDLTVFVQSLPQRPCLDFPVNVVTGNSAIHALNTLARQRDGEPSSSGRALRDGLAANATLRYTTLAHPGAWAASPGLFPVSSIRPFQRDCDQAGCFKDLFPDESLDDGGAIMGHDAVLTAVTAIQTVAGQRDLPADPIDRRELIQQWNALHGDDSVRGASGCISLDDNGNPAGKVIPVVSLLQDGTQVFTALTSSLDVLSTPLTAGDPCVSARPAAR